VANANRDPKRRRKPFEPRDFMPDFDNPKSGGQSWQALKAAFAGIAKRSEAKRSDGK